MVENCVLDWGAIATIAAAILTVIVAYCISKQWKTQKRWSHMFEQLKAYL